MQRFRINYNEEKEDEGIYGISLVEDAANGFQFVALKNQKKIEMKSDQEKRLLVSPVLVPDQQIDRNWTSDGCTVQFDSDTIRRASQNFIKDGYQRNSKINHEGDWVDGISVVESWIVEDPAHDKSSLYGFDVPVGTWMSIMKVNSDDLWFNYIKTGKVKGFSIDSYFGIEKIYEDVKLQIQKNNKQSKQTNMFTNFFNFSSTTAKKVKLAVDLLEIEVEGLGKLWAASWEEGQVVYKAGEDGTQVPATEAEFTFEGKKYTTDVEGKITVIEEVPTDVAVEMSKMISAALAVEFAKLRKELNLEATAEEVAQVAEDRSDETQDVLDEAQDAADAEDLETVKAKLAEAQAELEKLKEELAAKVGEVEAAQAEAVELKAQVAAAPATTQTVVTKTQKVDFSNKKMTRAEFFASQR